MPPFNSPSFKASQPRTASMRMSTQKPHAMTGLIDSVARDLGLESLAQKLAVLSLWPQILKHVAPEFIDVTQALGIIRRANGEQFIHVAATDAATATAMSFYGNAFRDALNAFAPQTGVTLVGILPVVRPGLF
ncbi:MAG: hypothetical protein VKK59_04360 [Vampirovibrionales bacterium]|nr:hypothetical protein [Vampirovibrionales bacterium]